jgi:hypothetical protein
MLKSTSWLVKKSLASWIPADLVAGNQPTLVAIVFFSIVQVPRYQFKRFSSGMPTSAIGQ